MTSCRSCSAPLTQTFIDLGISPLANSFLTQENLSQGEKFYPLHAFVCTTCFLVQLKEFESPDHIFSDYVYFSSYSESWLRHARDFVSGAVKAYGLSEKSFVVEIASNDGYLLKNFLPLRIPILGIEPARNVAKVAEALGVPTRTVFFGEAEAKKVRNETQAANLIIANNVFAHVPKLNDFAAGLKHLLAPEGVVSLEFPHLLELVRHSQFDTIYHEHFSYFSLMSAQGVLERHGLRVFKAERLDTHGGSLRLSVCLQGATRWKLDSSVADVMGLESEHGLNKLAGYLGFERKAQILKLELLKFLVDAKTQGKSIVAYGAAAKGNTLLNYCGIKGDLLDYTVDKSPYKQNHFLPGTRIPVYGPEKILDTRPDYVLILPWNIKEEIMNQTVAIRNWNGKFVIATPSLQIISPEAIGR